MDFDIKKMLLQAAKLLMKPGKVYELRALGVPSGGGYTKTFAGWFDCPEKLAEAAYRLDGQAPDYVSITLNPVNPDLLARSANKIKHLKKEDATTTDADIIERAWLPIDFDPIRPAGISSSDEEHQAAMQLAFQVIDDMTAEGWPEPILASSGNGAHVVYPINLPANKESDQICRDILRALAAKYDSDKVKIDTQLGNASRILKLWGILARKGSNIPARPHRRSEIIMPPMEIIPVSLEKLTNLAQTAPKIASSVPVPTGRPQGSEATMYERARAYLDKCEPAVAGQEGDRTTYRTACMLVNDFQLDDDTAFALFAEWNLRCNPPWDERDLRAKIRHARNYASKPAGNLAEKQLERQNANRRKDEIIRAKVEAMKSGAKQLTLRDIYNPAKSTDLGNAERLIAGSGGKIKYSTARGWYAWEGRYWIPEESIVRRLYHDIVVKNMYSEIEASYAEADSALTKALNDWAKRSESTRTMKSSLEMAACMPGVAVTVSEFDKDPMLLCCENGTVDLKTGELRPHAPADLITRISNVKYDKSAKCPKWEQFLIDIFQDPLLIEYIQLAIGYSLTGLTREQCMFIMYGTGQNGKSVFMNIIAALLGTYAMETPASTLMRGREDNSNQPSNDVARLAGARVVNANETEEGQALAESKIKAMTGDDVMIARFLHKEFFEFRPQFKIWVRTNHKPKIRGTDTGIWRRVKLIPFKVSIPAEKKDPELTNKLLAELPGILNWAVEGCLLWQHVGLKSPAAVDAATEDYRSSQDLIGMFLSETCEICPQKTSGYVKAKDLYKAYEDWCEEAGERAMPHRVLSIKLTERGFTKRRAFKVGQVIWDGLRLMGAEQTHQNSLYGGHNDQ